jgi:hypothetical protein
MQQSLLATQAELIFNYKGKCEGNWLDWNEYKIFFHSYDAFSHECKCVQKWSFQQLLNINSNYYWDK